MFCSRERKFFFFTNFSRDEVEEKKIETLGREKNTLSRRKTKKQKKKLSVWL